MNRIELSGRSWADVDAGWLGRGAAADLFADLSVSTPWVQRGRGIYRQPRLTAWYGDAGAVYAYSGIRHTPDAWTPALARLRDAVSASTGAIYNSVLLNFYRDGRDSVAWHADDEPELGPSPTIASLSLGAERMFSIRRKGGGGRRGIMLYNGCLITMGGAMQAEFEHSVQKMAVAGPRINLTFRRILSGGSN